MMVRKLYTLVLCLFLFSSLATAQSWPQGSGSRSSFEGFGIDYSNGYEDENSPEPSASGIFGDNAFISTMSEGDARDSSWGSTSPSDPGATAPITESILGLLGLGGVYAWRLIKGRNKKGKQE